MRPLPRLLLILLAIAWVSAGLALAGWLDTVPAMALSAGCGLALVASIVAAVSQPGLGWFGPAETRVPAEAGCVALTFDDGPHPESTPAILEALRAANARATFFLLVDRVERWPALARAIAAEHEVGLHGLRHHPWLTLWGPARGASELTEGRLRLETVIGRPVELFRPPFGVTSPRLAAATTRAGLRTIWCSLRTRDGIRVDDDVLLARCRRARAGDIVLLHEGPRPAARLLPTILVELAVRGLRSSAVGDLSRGRLEP